MRRARSLVVGAILLLAAHGGLARPRATATASASVTILHASAANLALPSSVVVAGGGPHSIRLGSAPRIGVISLLPNDAARAGADARFHLRLTSTGAILDVDVTRFERGSSLPIEVTYHQY